MLYQKSCTSETHHFVLFCNQYAVTTAPCFQLSRPLAVYLMLRLRGKVPVQIEQWTHDWMQLGL
jgi:hypothetical protein